MVLPNNTGNLAQGRAEAISTRASVLQHSGNPRLAFTRAAVLS
jgi:hypothetical protein